MMKGMSLHGKKMPKLFPLCGSKAYHLQQSTYCKYSYPANHRRKHKGSVNSVKDQLLNPRGQLLFCLKLVNDFCFL
uniref:Uncharacterized protein n=1 Tax=Spermophilus dauricus TaxID=99837 RepID=A0A8C9PCD9_SPEDA